MRSGNDLHGLDLWDAKTGRRTAHVDTRYAPEAIAFTSDSKRIATFGRGFLRIADVQSGATLHEFDLRDRPWRAYRHREYLAFLAKDRQILLADMRTEEVSLLDAETGKEIRKFFSKTKGVAAATLTLGGPPLTLAIADESRRNSACGCCHRGRTIEIGERVSGNWQAMTCSPDGKVLAAGTPERYLFFGILPQESRRTNLSGRQVCTRLKNTRKKEAQVF